TRYEAVGGSVRVWDLGAGRVLYTKAQPGPTISCAAVFSPDGKRLVTEVNGGIHVREARSGRHVKTLKLPPGGIAAMSFSPDGRRLAVANWAGNRVKLFDRVGNKLTEGKDVLDHRRPVAAVVYSPDGKFLASGDPSGFTLWDARTLKKIQTFGAQAQQL